MGLWSFCWRNWNIFNLARNQKKMERKKKHGGSYFLFQTYAESTNKLNVFVLQRYFPPAVTDSIFLSHFVLECLTARTASFGLEGKKQTWWLLIFLEVFSPCWHLQRDLALFYKEVFSNEQDPTCANSAAQRVSFISGSHSHKTNWGLFSWSSLSCKALPLLHNPEFLYLSSAPPPSPVFSLSLLSPFCTLLPEKQVEQLPEACVQGGYPWLSHLNRLFSMRQRWVVNLQEPART